jgi:hypothetical protein
MSKLKSIFALDIDGTDYATDLVSFELTSDEADSDSMTLSEYNAGTNRDWVLSVTAIFDGGSENSLHAFLWENAGLTSDFLIQPRSGLSTPDNPKYFGLIRIPHRPDITGEAGEAFTFEYEFELIGQPLKYTDGSEGDIFGDIFGEYF